MAIEGLNQESFSFSDIFQKQVLTALVRQPKFFEKVGLFINPDNFEIKEYRDIFKAMKDYYMEFKSLPGQAVLYEMVKDKSDIPELASDINDIYNKNIKNSDAEYIDKKVSEFVDYQNMKHFFMNTIDYINDPDKYNEIRTELDKVLALRAAIEDNGVDVYSDNAVSSRLEKRKDNTESIMISSGWSNYDDIFNGGFEGGTITSVMSPANAGKSFILVNFGANIILQKKNVVHISLEMSTESVIRRYDSRLLGIPIKDLNNPDETVNKMKELLNQRLGRLFVKQFPALSVSAVDINAYIDRIETVNDIKIDVLIVDYADIMKAISSKISERRFMLEAIYMELRNIALERNIPVITATQISREGLKAVNEGKILDSSYIAESYGIARHLDNSTVINATAADLANHTLCLYVNKNRQGPMGQMLRMYCDYSKALVKPWADNPLKQTSPAEEAKKRIDQQNNKIKSMFGNI